MDWSCSSGLLRGISRKHLFSSEFLSTLENVDTSLKLHYFSKGNHLLQDQRRISDIAQHIEGEFKVFWDLCSKNILGSKISWH